MSSRSITRALEFGEHLEQLELPACQPDAVAANKSLELVGTDLELSRDQRAQIHRRAATAVSSHDRLDPSHHFLGMAGLAHPVVSAGAQAAHALSDCRVGGANDNAQVGKHSANPIEEVPGIGLNQAWIDEQRRQPHCCEILERDAAGEHAVLPSRGFEALCEHLEEAAVGIDDRETDSAPTSLIAARDRVDPRRRSDSSRILRAHSLVQC